MASGRHPWPTALQPPGYGVNFPVSLAGLRGPACPNRVLSGEPALLKTCLSKPLRKRKAFKISDLPLAFPTGSSGKEAACQCRLEVRDMGQPLGQEDPLEEGMATHSSIRAWRIPGTEEPGGLQSMESQRAGYD